MSLKLYAINFQKLNALFEENCAQNNQWECSSNDKKSKNPTRTLRRVRSYKIIISRKDFVKSFNVTIFYKNLAMPYKKTIISRPGLATQTIRFGLNDISSKSWNWAWMCLFLEIFSRHWFPRPKKFSLNKCFFPFSKTQRNKSEN